VAGQTATYAPLEGGRTMATTQSPEVPTRERERPPDASPLDQHAPPTTPTAKRSGRAMTSLILGIISIFAGVIPIAAWILGVTAIVLGATARTDIRRSGLMGEGQATAGIVCGAIGIAIGLAMFVVGLAAS
jgi:Domain of unknown function (DUF4190)